MYLFGDPLSRQTFHGSFTVSSWTREVGLERSTTTASPAGDVQTHEDEVRHALATLYRASDLRSCFVAADVLALDK